MTKLTDKQRLFVAEYLVDLNATQAAIRAGYSKKTARQQGQRLLTNVDIQTALSEAAGKILEKTEVTAERVVEEYRRLALSDMRQFVQWNKDGVKWLDSEELSEDAAACVSEVSETISEGGRTRRFKLHSKTHALDALAKYVGLFGDEAKPGVNVNVNVNVKAEEERRRDLEALHKEIAAYRRGYEDGETDGENERVIPEADRGGA